MTVLTKSSISFDILLCYMHFFDKNKSLLYWQLEHKDEKHHEATKMGRE